MRLRISILAGIALLAGLALARSAQEPAQEPAREPAAASAPRGGAVGNPWADEVERTIFFAVLEGLYEDGVGDDVAARLSARDEVSGMPRCFVYACPLCMPAWNALQLYRARPGFEGNKLGANTFGEGLTEAERTRLLAVDDAVVRDAVQGLIQRWVDRKLTSMRLTPEELDRWRQWLAERRKKGMAQLQAYQAQGFETPYAGMKGCPICDGANAACERR